MRSSFIYPKCILGEPAGSGVMLVAIIHGYFLKGTGSNLYVKNLCRELCRLGHEVNLFCQEQDFYDADFVNQFVEFGEDNSTQTVRWERRTDYLGNCTAYRPHIGDILPVYVLDNYDGYHAKEYTFMTEPEIEVYLRNNSTAIKHCFTHNLPDLVISNHTVMQPVYTVRACAEVSNCRHYMVVHGSCLNFAVRKSKLLQRYAQEAINGVERIVFLSNFSQQEFMSFFHGDVSLGEKVCVVPAGVDVEKFIPFEDRVQKQQRLSRCLSLLAHKSSANPGRTGEQKKKFAAKVREAKDQAELTAMLRGFENGDNWAPDQDAVDKLKSINWELSKTVLYYGKFLWTKGVHLLIAAIPLILQRHPDACFVLVGFGSFRNYLEALIATLDNGSSWIFLSLLSSPSLYHREIEQHGETYSVGLVERLRDPEFAKMYFAAAVSRISEQVTFTGFIDHDCLQDIIGCSDITVAPSIFPEAFGLVAVEALACGVVPIQTSHSGFTEVVRDYVDEFRDIFLHANLKPLYLQQDLILDLAHNISTYLDYYGKMDQGQRKEIRQRSRNIAIRKYSWRAMAERLLSF